MWLVKKPRPEIDRSAMSKMCTVDELPGTEMGNTAQTLMVLSWLQEQGLLEQQVHAKDLRLRCRRCIETEEWWERDPTLPPETSNRPKQHTIYIRVTLNLHALSATISLSARSRNHVLLQL